ncbi:gliding motility-associated C-terminal domain-containing protein [Chitinophaga sp. CF118]|uniref:PKD domain-containing protein n=1 Tax=Chitinophaga sp. CF118 TaxID=1884367 RepID=UPI0008E012A6|nr:PKD domain-containing protein [Chitinophaga sp. CF118]SFE06436.1 gliding motility-associated C-terminal domain-containing protein [Chitinophaga sp. CF118]
MIPVKNIFACLCSPPSGGGTSSKSLSITIALILITGIATYAQNLSNKGKDFWVSYGHHEFMEPGQPNSQEMILYLSAEQPAQVTVTLDGTTWTRSYTIPANTVIASDLIPKSGAFDARLYSVPPLFGGTGGEGLFTKKGIHITSDVPIVAYAHIYGSASSGATTLMPTETWGYYYVSLNSEQSYASDCFSWMYVVADHDNTQIQITPSVLTRNGRPAGVPFTVTLNKGQVYQVVGATTGATGLELTGTTVRSIANSADTCFPVAVFSGSSRTVIGCIPGQGSSGDNNMQQVFPSQAWGKRYLTAPTSVDNTPASLMTNIYKVVVKDPTTVVKRNGTVIPLASLIGNSYYRFVSNTADYIEADKPILVAQFMSSSGACPNTGGNGDPEMIYLSPVEQSIKKIGFYRNTVESITVNYLTMIIPKGGIPSLNIDGVLGAGALTYSYPHPNLPGYTVGIKKWIASKAQCLVQSDSGFTAITYGLGSVESYGYNAGTLINNLNVMGVIHNEQDTSSTKNAFTCTQTPVELSVLLAYQPTKMVWVINPLGAAITPNADVTVNAPVSTGQEMVNGVPYYKYTLPGTYQFSNTGTYDITIINTHPSIEKCDHTESVKISVTVQRKPKADFTFTHTGCALDSVYFKGSSSGNGYDINRWKWTFPGAAKDSGQDVHRKFATGQQNIQLRVISKEGCIADTIIPITIFAPPVANFSTSVNALCEGSSVSVTDQSTFGGTAPINAWHWNFNNGSIVNATTAAAQTTQYNGFGTYTIKHVVKVSDLCISDTVSKDVVVYAKPLLGFTYPNSCLDVNGIVQFNSTTTVPDAQTLNTYAWDFGDASATPANPNTSALEDPLHTYTKFGTYNIKYTVTTDKGCSKDTTVTATFKLKPQLAYTTLSAVCENDKSIISVAKASVINGVTGTGKYKGRGTSANGIFNPAVAGVGTHTLWYTFTTGTGCIDSISSTITVHPKPAASFNATDNVCLGEQVTITDQSAVPTGNITSWKWLLGDGTNETHTNNTPFNKTYTIWNTYTVKLVAVSDNNCVSDTAIRTVSVHPLPVADFAMPAAICMPEGKAVFTNRTTVADKSTLAYEWSFGDNTATSADGSPVHYYKTKGPFTVTLETTSLYGCTSSKSQTLDAFFNQPVAGFTVAPDTLCEGADNNFTDQSTDAGNNIKTWSWYFGDGSTATDPNPVKRYNMPGEYNVQLTVINGAGCVSAPFTGKVVVYLQPVIDAGPSFIVPQGTEVFFKPTANDSTVLTFQWSPPDGLSSTSVLSPKLLAMHDQVYTLTATGLGQCTATDVLTVKVFKPVKVPNVFSPNGDQINDRWEIPNLSDYPGCTVEVFNRYGQRVFNSLGYETPWDGRSNGKLLPLATYYYIIKLKNGFAPLSGSITILQ